MADATTGMNSAAADFSVRLATQNPQLAAFSGVSGAQPVEVIILPASSADISTANHLFEDLVKVLSEMGAKALPPENQNDYLPRPAEGKRSILVVVFSETCDEEARELVRPWLEVAAKDEDAFAILPVLHMEVKTSGLRTIEEGMRELNVGRWKTNVRELTPQVLLLSRAVPEGFRIFISYRRIDSQALADQIHDGLVRRGFSVFLDLVSVPVASRFQNYLTHQLEDRSMLVVLETPRFDSPWTQYEVGFARRRRLGICSIRIPKMTLETDSISEDLETKVQASIDPSLRQDLAPSDFQDAAPKLPTSKSTLTEEALKRVLDEIERQHNLAFVRRRDMLLKDLNGALTHHRLDPCQWDGIGAYFLDLPDCKVKFVLCPRPVELAQIFDGFHREPIHSPPNTWLVIVAPHLWASPKRIAHLAWVRSSHHIQQVDPQHLYLFAARLASFASEPAA